MYQRFSFYEKNNNENQKQKKKRIIQENNMQNKIITQEYTQNTITSYKMCHSEIKKIRRKCISEHGFNLSL